MQDRGQRGSVARVGERKTAHQAPDDDPQDLPPLLGILHLHVQPKRPDGGLSMPPRRADRLEDGVHVVPKLRDLAVLHLAAPPDLLVALDDALAHLGLVLLQPSDLLLRRFGLPEEAQLLACGVLLFRLLVCQFGVGLLELRGGLITLAAGAGLGAGMLVGDLLLEPCDGGIDPR